MSLANGEGSARFGLGMTSTIASRHWEGDALDGDTVPSGVEGVWVIGEVFWNARRAAVEEYGAEGLGLG
jgi:hypothetical protein